MVSLKLIVLLGSCAVLGAGAVPYRSTEVASAFKDKESSSNEVEARSNDDEDDDGDYSEQIEPDSVTVVSNGYTYHASWAGFLKVHRYPQTWRDALLRCRLEGSILSTPLTGQQLEDFESLLRKHDISAAYTGLHDLFSTGDFVTIEGTPLNQLHLKWSQYEPDNHDNNESCLVLRMRHGSDSFGLADQNCNRTAPFICYKEYSNNLVVSHCNTADPEYEYNHRTGSCFKFHGTPQTWSRAYMTCTAEGGRLSVPNTFEKVEVLKKIFAKYPETYSLSGDIVLMGFSDILEEGRWQNLDGTLMFGRSTRKDYHCGAMWRNGNLNEVSCDHPYAFICEK